MSNPREPLPGSARLAPRGRVLGGADPGERIEVSVYLKCAAPDGPVSRDDLCAERTQALASDVAALERFAAEHGLKVTLKDCARRLVKLAGSVAQFEAAFGTKLEHVEHDGVRFRARSGTLSVPTGLADRIEAVLGLDTRPAATPKIVFPRAPQAATSHKPSEVAALYGFPPAARGGTSQCVALIELGGGFLDSDTAAAFAAMTLATPEVVAVPVSGGSNAPGKDPGADGEVALDIQVAGGAAPGSRIAVYFAPNTDQGFVDAITAAVHDQTNAPSVLSISWGAAESNWSQQAVTSMNSAFADAAKLSVTVTAASGDGLAADGVTDGQAHVDFPASSPYVLGCGGTRLTTRNGAITSETVWNSEGGGSGGGVSALFPLPTYQQGAHVPVSVSTGKAGRGVPDVAADADPGTGYSVIVGGKTQVVGGTSAAAPLWAGLFALLNRTGGKPVGQPHATLYRNTKVFRDITEGNNNSDGVGYAAGAGWDACTGLGSPDGAALAKAFAPSVA
jgi:kumamolisin